MKKRVRKIAIYAILFADELTEMTLPATSRVIVPLNCSESIFCFFGGDIEVGRNKLMMIKIY